MNNKKYQIIYADPPWHYQNYDNDTASRWVGDQYGTMSSEDIKNLPIWELADKDCILFLWATFPTLPQAMETISAWGFKYKTLGFCWVKRNKKTPSLFWGMGHWTRQNPEVCLIATKGSPKRLSASVHSVIEAPIREHSRKPDETRDRIEKLLGGGLTKIELFARQKTDGWDVWGNEVESDVVIPRI